jgi:hypothetical protein
MGHVVSALMNRRHGLVRLFTELLEERVVQASRILEAEPSANPFILWVPFGCEECDTISSLGVNQMNCTPIAPSGFWRPVNLREYRTPIAVYGVQDGSIRQVQAAECIRSMTDDRARELEKGMTFD